MSLGARRIALTLAAVAMGFGSILASSPRRATAQQAVLSCPGSFANRPLSSGPASRDLDGQGVAHCEYGRTEFASTTFMSFEVRWAERDIGFTNRALCGEPRTLREPHGNTIGYGAEIPSATKQARVSFGGDYYADPNHRPESDQFALALMAQVEPTAIPLPCEEKRTDEVTCLITVSDRSGRPVQGARTVLEGQNGRLDGVTDVQGGTKFSKVKIGDTVIGTVTLEDGEHDPPQFRIETDDIPSSAHTRPTPVTKDSPCELKLDARGVNPSVESERPGPRLWPDSVEIYQRVRQAMRMAAQLGPITYGLPLRVHTFCTLAEFQCAPGKDVTHASEGRIGSQNFRVNEPFIAMGESSSSLSYNGRPDNREYHEMGHWFQANLLGDLVPIDCSEGQDCTHKGYFVNGNSTDSYVEGFASFFSMMVSKHIDLRSFPELFRFYGSYINLERDRLAWEAKGRYEEFAVAGILLDMEDGPLDYTSTSTNTADLKLDCCAAGRDVAEGFVVNESPEGSGLTAHGVHVTVTLPNGKKKDVPTIPSEIPPGGAARVVVPTVGVAPGTQLNATVSTGPKNGTDDDQVTVPVRTIMQTIAAAHGPDGGPIANMSQLHDLFKRAFGADKNANGVDDVDEIFVNHGFFDDIDGDQLWKAGDAVGPSAHNAQQGFPAIAPRSHADVPAALQIPVVTGRADAQVLVDVEYPEKDAAKSFAYVAQPDGAGIMFADIPPEGSGATVTLVALATGVAPVIVGQIAPDDFWKVVEQDPDQPAARFAVSLGTAAPSADTADDGDSYSKAGLVVMGLLAAAGLVLILTVRSRRWLGMACIGAALAVLAWSVTLGAQDATRRDAADTGGVQLAAANFDSPLGGTDGETSSPAPDASTSSSGVSTTSTTIASGNDITIEGVVDPESSTPGFPPTLAVDRDPATSWLSGPAAGDDGASEFAWLSENHFNITAVRITPTNLAGKGFATVEVDLVAGEGETVYSQTVVMEGTSEIVITPNVNARAVLLVFRGHQDPNGSGFAELHVEGN